MNRCGIYSEWRAQNWAAQTLAERPAGSCLTEQLLQLIWHHQRLRRDELRTADGRPVRILHPGFWNHESGPDFRGAVVQFGDALARHGDIEVDLAGYLWHAHGHDQNPAFRAVILHVVWEAAPDGERPLPTLSLKPFLDASLEELSCWLRREPRPVPVGLLGQCFAGLRALTKDQLLDLLRDAARVRLQTKADQLHARGRQVGWEQALWEALFGALGYKNNVWPMRRISELLPTLRVNDGHPVPARALQARLLGVSGLLPNDLAKSSWWAREYLRDIWNLWWREREQFAELSLPRNLWRLGGLRPANNPQRRLALAAHWLAEEDLPAKIEAWFASVRPNSRLERSLLAVLQTREDEFWSRHWTFHSARMAESQPMIGPQRVTDLAMNVILPWFWIRADLGKNDALRRLAEECYFAWPKAEDNAVLRLALRRLLDSARQTEINTAAMQQAVLQIVRDFCDYSNALCAHCQFPQRLQELVGGD